LSHSILWASCPFSSPSLRQIPEINIVEITLECTSFKPLLKYLEEEFLKKLWKEPQYSHDFATVVQIKNKRLQLKLEGGKEELF
jgi:hypothetical protein